MSVGQGEWNWVFMQSFRRPLDVARVAWQNEGMEGVILQQRFVDNVLRLLDEQGMSQSDLARKMGKSRQYIGDYLLMRRSPGFDVVEGFAKALGVDPSELTMEPIHA